jgi:8-oxo-dGTP diphosphatase
VTLLDGWQFCPRCRTPLEVGEHRVSCPACGFEAYANPALTACALCVDTAGRLLLARRAGPPFAGRWDLPGGFVDEGEHPLETVRRELREETGLEVEPEELVGIWVDRYSEDGSGRATVNLYWTARLAGEDEVTPTPADDVSEVRWFAVAQLPTADELAFHIADVLSAWRSRREQDA